MRLGKKISIKGIWQNITMKINYTKPIEGQATLFLKAFITAHPSLTSGQNILGISPGPKSLQDYQFYYNFLDPGNAISSVEISVKMQPGYHFQYSNWKFDSNLYIN